MFEHLLSGNFSFAVVGGILLAPPAVPFLLPLARRSASARIARFLEEPRYWADAEWRIDAACALLRSLPRAQRAAVKRFVQIVAHTDEGPNDEGSLREYRSQLITSFEAEWIRSERLTTPSPLERRRMLAILLLRLDVPSIEVSQILKKGPKRGSSESACRYLIMQTVSDRLRGIE